jgi:hypothetical protein
MGLDSLMAVELKNRLEADTGARIAIEQLLQGPTVEELEVRLLEDLVASPVDDPPPAGLHAADVSQLSDEDVDALLRSMLDQPA